MWGVGGGLLAALHKHDENIEVSFMPTYVLTLGGILAAAQQFTNSSPF